jgi:hypothetical protein
MVDGAKGAIPVETGFIVYNEATYPNLAALFEHLDVPTQHGDGGGRPRRDPFEEHLRAAGLAPDGGAIRLFCMPRVFGFGFNPLSVYFCYQRDGSLAAIRYEVHNRFRERHSYLIPVEHDARVAGAPGAVIDQHCREAFFVSPFMDMEMNYTFRVAVPDQRVTIAIRAADQDGPITVVNSEG